MGTIPQLQQQNVFGGLPLLLSLNEVTLLLKKSLFLQESHLELIRLYDASIPFPSSSSEEIQKFEKDRE